VNQNTPNNSEERAGAAGDHLEQAGQGGAEHRENPYFARQREMETPDLVANEPVLRSSDLKRLNRKALFFLACIAGLLVLAVLWLVSRGDEKPVEAKPRAESVQVPALPQNVNAPPVQARPVPLVQSPDIPPLPPMPDVESARRDVAPVDRGPSILDRRIMAAGGSSGDGSLPAAPGSGPFGLVRPQTAMPGLEDQQTSAKPIANPDGLLVRGTYIRCVLETRIISDFPGFTSCIITEPVYSINGRRLLLPKGSKILGQYGSAEPSGPRMEVIWDRITTPTGIDVNLIAPGIDNLGSSGHPGQYSAHWASRITSALLISMISDAFKWAAAEHGPSTTTVGLGSGIITEQPYESNTAQAMQKLSDQALERAGRRRATVTINQGTVVNVYVAKDVDFTSVLPK
jgi:type IV secretion system protein VirB10